MLPTPAPTAPAPPAPPSPPAAPAQPAERPRASRLGLQLAIVSLASAVIASSLTAILVVPTLMSADGSSAAAPGASGAVGTTVSTSASGGSGDAVVDVAQRATPAVVTISTQADAQTFFGNSVSGTGSGFIYGANGLILTNDHVVNGATSLTVTLLDGRHFPATVIATDPNHDLAIVKIAATGLPTLALGTSDRLAVGEELVVIGSPLGTFTGSVTSGILSATNRSITVTDELTHQPRQLTGLLQTDAAVNPGNSGGPILDLAGNVVGIATATSTTAQGLGFGVPISEVVGLVAKAKSAI